MVLRRVAKVRSRRSDVMAQTAIVRRHVTVTDLAPMPNVIGPEVNATATGHVAKVIESDLAVKGNVTVIDRVVRVNVTVIDRVVRVIEMEIVNEASVMVIENVVKPTAIVIVRGPMEKASAKSPRKTNK